VRKDGTRFWAHVVIDPIRDRDGPIVGYSKVTRDLTERKKAENALQKSEQQFRLLVQGVTDYAIYMLDTKRRVTNWNLGAERIKGYLSHEIIGHHFSKFYTEEDRAKEEPQKALDTAIREERFEKEGWRKDGIFGPASLLIQFAMKKVRYLGSQKLRAIFQNGGKCKWPSKKRVKHCSSRKRWTRLVN
jgi:PAS domain S-box-containing protein